MFSLNLTYEIPGVGAEQIFEACASNLSTMLSTYGVTDASFLAQEEETRLRVQHAWFEGVMQCKDQQLDLRFQLSWKARPFKGMIERGVEQWIRETFQL
jgi:hypothetical protein